MAMRLFHSGNRALQDRFGSRNLADRLQGIARTAFSEDDRAFIASLPYFFLASADAGGRPDCSFKGGPPGFVQVTGPSELAFPDYDGNGMFKSLGNCRSIQGSACCSSRCTDSPGGCASMGGRPFVPTIRCLGRPSARR
jgi:predicted pyridoxine 5'-phosphate oxidase superfamily flavin-nucleotide-binding protein